MPKLRSFLILKYLIVRIIEAFIIKRIKRAHENKKAGYFIEY